MLYATMLEDVDPTCCVRLNRPLIKMVLYLRSHFSPLCGFPKYPEVQLSQLSPEVKQEYRVFTGKFNVHFLMKKSSRSANFEIVHSVTEIWAYL